MGEIEQKGAVTKLKLFRNDSKIIKEGHRQGKQ